MNDVHTLLVQLPSLEGFCDRRNSVVHHILLYLIISLAKKTMIKEQCQSTVTCMCALVCMHVYMYSVCMRTCVLLIDGWTASPADTRPIFKQLGTM